jgi:hypothetical protein
MRALNWSVEAPRRLKGRAHGRGELGDCHKVEWRVAGLPEPCQRETQPRMRLCHRPGRTDGRERTESLSYGIKAICIIFVECSRIIWEYRSAMVIAFHAN